MMKDRRSDRLSSAIKKIATRCPVGNTDTKLLIYGLFQMGRVLAQDGMQFPDASRSAIQGARPQQRANPPSLTVKR